MKNIKGEASNSEEGEWIYLKMRWLSGVEKWVRSQYLGEVHMHKEYEFVDEKED